jgi:hypothetical protein
MKVISGVAGDGNTPRFCWMLKLAMTAYRRYQIPTIASEEFEDITNLQGVGIIDDSVENQKPTRHGLRTARI